MLRMTVLVRSALPLALLYRSREHLFPCQLDLFGLQRRNLVTCQAHLVRPRAPPPLATLPHMQPQRSRLLPPCRQNLLEKVGRSRPSRPLRPRVHHLRHWMHHTPQRVLKCIQQSSPLHQASQTAAQRCKLTVAMFVMSQTQTSWHVGAHS